jgi:tetratricopeptide (TPR) repeat protein
VTKLRRRRESDTRRLSSSAAPVAVTTSPSRRWPISHAELGVFLAALALRLAHVWALSNSPFATMLLGDAGTYDAWARRLAEGGWFQTAAFYQAPLYPYALGVVYAIAGPSVMWARVAQAVLGAATCAVLCRAGTRWFGPRAGLISGVIFAVYGPALFLGGLLQKSVLDALLVSGMLLWLAPAGPLTRLRGLRLGVAVGCLALTRENGLVALPVILLWCLLARDRRPLLPALIAGVFLVLGPVAVHNHRAGAGWALTTSQLGPNLYIGNSANATGTYVALRHGHGNAAYEQQDATELASAAAGRRLSPAEVSNYWRNQAADWIGQHPAAWARLYAFKLFLALNGREAADTEDVTSHATWSWVLRLTDAIANFGWLAPLAVLGLYLTRGRWRELWPLYAFGAVFLMSVAIFYVLDRYRYPVVPVLTLFAGAALGDGVAWWRHSHARERSLALAVACAAALLCNWPVALLSPTAAEAVTHYNLGYVLQSDGRTSAAIEEYRHAARLLPTDADVHSNLGVALAAVGRNEEALAEYRTAVQLDPSVTEAHINLGIALASLGRHAEAMTEFDEAIRLDPHSAEAHYNRATALGAQGQAEAAIEEFRRTVRLDPQNSAAHNNLGVLLASIGQLPAAIQEFEAAVRLRADFREARANLANAQGLVSRRR